MANDVIVPIGVDTKSIKPAMDKAAKATDLWTKSLTDAAKAVDSLEKESAQFATDLVRALKAIRSSTTAQNENVKVRQASVSVAKKLTLEERTLAKAFNASLTPLQRLQQRQFELNKLSVKTLKTEKAKIAQIGIANKIERAQRRERENAGRTLSNLFDEQNKVLSQLRIMPAALSSSSGGFSALAGSVKALVNPVTLSVAGIAGLTAGIIKATLHSAEFTQSLRTLQNISGASAAQLTILEDAAIRAGIATQFSPTEAVAGLKELAALGFTVTEQVSALVPTLDLASAGNLSVAEAASIAGSALKAYGFEASQAGMVGDKLAAITSVSALQFNDLQLALANSSAGAIAANQSLDEMLVTMGLARNAGLNVEVVATGLSRALLEMGKEAEGAFEDMGIAVETSEGKFRPFGDILVDLAEKTRDMTDVQKQQAIQQALGTFGMKSALPIIKQLETGIKTSTGEVLHNAEALEFLRQQVNDSAGTLERFRENQLDTLAGKMILLGGSVDTLVTTFGKEFDPALAGAVEVVIDITNAIIPMTTAIADTIKFWSGWVGWVVKFNTGILATIPGLEKLNEILGRGAEEAVTPLAKLQEQLAKNTKELSALQAQQEQNRLVTFGLEKEIDARKRLIQMTGAQIKILEAEAKGIDLVADRRKEEAAALLAKSRAEAKAAKEQAEASKANEKAAAARKKANEELADFNKAMEMRALKQAQVTREVEEAAAKELALAAATRELESAFNRASFEAEELVFEICELPEMTKFEKTFGPMISKGVEGFAMLKDKIAGVMSGVGAAAAGVTAAFAGVFGLVSKVTQLVSGMSLSDLAKEGKNAGKILGDSIANFDFGGFFVNLAEGLSGAFQAIADNPQIWKQFAEGLGSAVQILADNAQLFVDIVLAIFQAVVDNIDVLIPAFIKLGGALGIGLIKAIPEIVSGIGDAIAQLFVEAVATVLEVFGFDKRASELRGEMGTAQTTTTSTGSTAQNQQNLQGGTPVTTPTVSVSDAYLGPAPERRNIQDTPGDSVIAFQTGGANDPATLMRPITQLLANILEESQKGNSIMISMKSTGRGGGLLTGAVNKGPSRMRS